MLTGETTKYTDEKTEYTDETNITRRLSIQYVMGNLRKPLNFQLVWTRKGAMEPWHSYWYCAARFTCGKGNFFAIVSEHCVQSGKVLWCPRRSIFVRRGPILVCNHVISILGIKCE